MNTTSAALPLSVRAQRVLLWVMAVLIFGNAAMDFAEAGGGPFGLGYALRYVLIGAVITVLALRTGTGRRWVRICVIVLHAVILVLQLSRVLDGDVFGLVGLAFPVTGLVLAFRRTARDFFAADGPVRGHAPAGGPFTGRKPPPFPFPPVPHADAPRMPAQLRVQRVMLLLMPAWTLLMVASMVRWENTAAVTASELLLLAWLAAPGAVALVCALRLRRGGPLLLYTIAGFLTAVAALNVWWGAFGGPPILQALPFTVLTAVPLLFPSSWRYARANRRAHRARRATDDTEPFDDKTLT